MATNGSLPDQATIPQAANMASFDNSSDYDSDSEYFDSRGYFDADPEDEFYEARSTFDNEADSAEKEPTQLNNNKKQESPKQPVEKEDPIPSATVTNSVLSEKRKLDNVAQDDQDTDSNSSNTPSSPRDVSENRAKKLKPVVAFGQSTGFGTMKVPQVLSSIKATAPTVGLFKTENPLSFGTATTTYDNNTVFNNASTTTPGHDNKENISHTFGEGPHSTLAGVEEIKVVETGEEEEDTVCQSKAKLYRLDKQTWKERGVGPFRLNKNNNNNGSRFIMRTDSVHRLILNAKLFPGMSVSIMQDKFIRFGVFEAVTDEEGNTETKMANYALKFGSSTTAKEVCKHITSCIPPASAPKRTHDELADEDDDDEQPPSPKAQVNRRLSPKKQRNL